MGASAACSILIAALLRAEIRPILPGEGLEPTRISPPDPKSGASANSAIRALLSANYLVLLSRSLFDFVRRFVRL
jgi:hypothetical protein